MFDKIKNLWKALGPGLITGASDDDPSGIAVYAVAGAKFGLGVLWTVVATLPFMIVIERMAGRIGLVSGKGLAGNMKKHYPRWILIFITTIIVGATIINIGADISGMAAALNLLIPFPPILLSAIISATIILLLIFLSYRHIARYLKWVAIVLFAYVAAAFLVAEPWREVFLRTFIPKITLSREYLAMIVALFGTTISPYLFFWQASEIVEEERMHRNLKNDAHMIPDIKPHGPHRSTTIIKNEISYMYRDLNYGMVFSNLITFFIIALSAATLHNNHFTNVATIEQIAQILRPLAGQYTNLLFLIGITASGILAVPVLAGSAAYAVAEVFGWKEGFDNKFENAKGFYSILIISTLLGFLIPILNIHPVDILYYTAVIFGVVSPFMILMVIHMANNPKIMGKFISRHYSNVIAYLLFLIMSASVILMLVL